MTCCEAFEHAQHPGTDGEEYGPAVGPGFQTPKGQLYVGSSSKTPPISYCPWCGTKLTNDA